MTALPTAPDDIVVMAGEYVLGTLDTRTARAVAAAAERDPAWRDAIARWERHFIPLGALAVAEAPPPNLWSRIEAAVGGGKSRPPARARTPWHWPAWAGGATAVAAVFAVQLYVFTPPIPTMTAVLLPDQAEPPFVSATAPGSAVPTMSVASASASAAGVVRQGSARGPGVIMQGGAPQGAGVLATAGAAATPSPPRIPAPPSSAFAPAPVPRRAVESLVPAFVVSVMPGGSVHVAALRTSAGATAVPPPGSAFEVWEREPGATQARKLGVMPAGASATIIDRPGTPARAGTQIMISIEPPGGSPTGQPSGKMVYFGWLERVDPPA